MEKNQLFNKEKALVVFSGGQDSTTCLGWALNHFKEVFAITFKYGQKHKIEVEQSKIICEKLKIPQLIIDIDFLDKIVDSELISKVEGEINFNKAHSQKTNLPSSFVPNRNALFLTLAHAYAQKIGVLNLITGVCQTDYSGYPDCRQIFLDKLEAALMEGSEAYIKIWAPLMFLDKAQTFKLAEDNNILDIVLKDSQTCYNGNHTTCHDWGYGCGNCPACKLRAKGYESYKVIYNNN